MKTLAVTIAIAAIVAVTGAVCPASWAARCTGSAYCRACTTCRYCAHCAKRGGTCGVCAVLYQPAQPRLSVTERTAGKGSPQPVGKVKAIAKTSGRSVGKVETINAVVFNIYRTKEGDVLDLGLEGNYRVIYTSRRFSYPETPFSVLLTRRYGKRWVLHIAGGNPSGAVIYVERIGQ